MARKCSYMSTTQKRKNYFNVAAFATMRDAQEVTEERFDEMLCVLPPERMASNAFLVGEPVDHDRWGSPRFDLFFRNAGRFYSGGIITTADFDSMLI